MTEKKEKRNKRDFRLTKSDCSFLTIQTVVFLSFVTELFVLLPEHLPKQLFGVRPNKSSQSSVIVAGKRQNVCFLVLLPSFLLSFLLSFLFLSFFLSFILSLFPSLWSHFLLSFCLSLFYFVFIYFLFSFFSVFPSFFSFCLSGFPVPSCMIRIRQRST